MEHHNNIAKHMVKKHTILIKNIIIGIFLFLPFLVNGQTAPTVTTAAVSDITDASATLGGEVTSDGGATVSERGIVYSTTDDTPAGLNRMISAPITNKPEANIIAPTQATAFTTGSTSTCGNSSSDFFTPPLMTAAGLIFGGLACRAW